MNEIMPVLKEEEIRRECVLALDGFDFDDIKKGAKAQNKADRKWMVDRIARGLKDTYATTVNPNPAFQDSSQGHSYMARMYALEKMITGIGQALKEVIDE